VIRDRLSADLVQLPLRSRTRAMSFGDIWWSVGFRQNERVVTAMVDLNSEGRRTALSAPVGRAPRPFGGLYARLAR